MDAKTPASHGQNTQSAELKIGDKSIEFPVYAGTIGPAVVDNSKPYAQGGVFTYDPGFTSTGSCESKIT
jgi:citrate synthase